MKEQIEFTTSIEINVNVETVWKIFFDKSKYLEWNPFIKKIYGKIALNKIILEFAYFYNHLYLPIFMKIIELDFEKQITWVGKMPGFADHHIYKFQKIGQEKMIFSHEARFTGFIVNLSRNHISTNVKRVHEEMNYALKNRCEKK